MNITSLFHLQGEESGLPSLASQRLHLMANLNSMGQFLRSQIPVSAVTEDHTVPSFFFETNSLWPWLSFITMRFLLYWFNQISPQIGTVFSIQIRKDYWLEVNGKTFLSYFSSSEHRLPWYYLKNEDIISRLSKGCWEGDMENSAFLGGSTEYRHWTREARAQL